MGKKYKDKQKHNEEKEEDVNKGKKSHDKGAAGRTLKDKEEHINKSKDKAEKKAEKEEADKLTLGKELYKAVEKPIAVKRTLEDKGKHGKGSKDKEDTEAEKDEKKDDDKPKSTAEK